jgi:SAM-dependent methyltransferase
MPSPQKIKSIYNDYYLESDTEKFTFHGVHRLVDHIFRRIHLTPSHKIYRILEIGGGDGTLSREIGNRILQQNSQLQIEISEVELYKGKDTVDETIKFQSFESLTQVEGRFDLVIASAVIHQIPENNEILRGLFARVRNGGLFFARTAFILPIARLLGRFIDILYPFHVHDLGCHFWNSVPDNFSLNAEILSSRPSLVESQISRAPINALAGHLLKFPAHIELLIGGRKKRCPFWTFVGGWEVFLKFH